MNKGWLISIILLIIQLVVLLIIIPTLINNIGIVSLIIPILLALIIAGMFQKKQNYFLAAFIWSLFVLSHSIALLIFNNQLLGWFYFAFAIVQTIVISQTKIK